MYTTILDAKTELENSGVFEMFDFPEGDAQSRDFEMGVARWMFRNNETPENAAIHYGVMEAG